jgi:hypothetical protein
MTSKKLSPAAIITRILGRFTKESSSRTGMARGFLVVDENVSFLEPALEQANFHVATPDKGLEDPLIKKRLLGNRIFVTKNTRHFLDDAPVYDYGIIGLEALTFLDPSATYQENVTAQLISAAFRKFRLHAERGGFVLMLRADGKHKFKRLG